MSLGDKKELFGIIKNYNARRRPVFLYASPQTLDGLKKELTEITMKDILRLVVIDEYHFLLDYAYGFRLEFNRIFVNLLDKFMSKKPPWPLLLMSTSNTMDVVCGQRKFLKSLNYVLDRDCH